MLYRTHIPRWPLCEFVDLLWYCEGYEPAHAKERVLPDGSLQIIVSLQHETIPVYDGENFQEVGRLGRNSSGDEEFGDSQPRPTNPR